MADKDETRQKLYAAITNRAEDPRTTPGELRDLAEAFAYTTFPNQPHGGGTVIQK